MSPCSRMLYTPYIPLILPRVKSRVFDFAENPVAAALAGSSASVPMETFLYGVDSRGNAGFGFWQMAYAGDGTAEA